VRKLRGRKTGSPFQKCQLATWRKQCHAPSIAEPLRELAIKFAHLANSCTDKCTANDLQEARVELVEKLDDPFKNIDAAS
jgi:hypothetical protein